MLPPLIGERRGFNGPDADCLVFQYATTEPYSIMTDYLWDWLVSPGAASTACKPPSTYSPRSATAGSTVVARRAGSHAAAKATAPRAHAASAITTGSVALT